MGDEIEAGGASAAPAEAPAAAAPAEPATDAAAEGSVDTSLSTDSEASPPASFDWDSWDGETDSLPEAAREWAKPIGSYFSKRADTRLEERLTEVEDLKELYDSLLSGKRDPKIGELEKALAEWEEKHNGVISEWEGKYNELEKTYKQYEANVEAAITQEAVEYAEWFQSENADVFENEQLAAVFVGLLEEGWELEGAAEAARLPAPLLQAARQAKADGVPDSYAIRLAGRAKSPAAPRPGAKITSGATTPARSREQTMLPDTKAPASFKDLRHHAATRALKRKRGN